MAPGPEDQGAGGLPRRLHFRTGGFLWNRPLRDMLAAAGHELVLGPARPGDGVAVWGHSPYALRGETLAAARDLPLVRVEDAFLRSIHPGRGGEAPLGLMIEGDAAHYDPRKPSRIERILSTDPLDSTPLLDRAKLAMARLAALDLSKYNAHRPDLPGPAPGYVLVVDQTRGDASVRLSGATEATFRDMLVTAITENPGARVVVKLHPETTAGFRAGHFDPATLPQGVEVESGPVSPKSLLEGALAVYTLSSQLGFEAVLCGHRPHVFGQPFYAGWGLTHDRNPPPRRGRNLTRAQLFAGAMVLAPFWYDPFRREPCSIETALDILEARVRAFRQDRDGWVAGGMRLWKRGHLQAFFGREKPLRFRSTAAQAEALAKATGRSALVWANRAEGASATRVEDGFLRSRGLGADLVPPLSLVLDQKGIYYDPTRDSDLEALIRAPLPPGGAARAERLIDRLRAARVSKYNLSGALPDLPEGHRVLVPGQVEDDASIRLGATGPVRSNLDLLRAARSALPGAVLIFKPHPDVEAGLRPGRIAPETLQGLADVVADHADPLALIEAVDEVWTLTSLLGFEALLRGRRVTCLGAPFYAGWGLTQDLAPVPDRRRIGPDGHPLPRISLVQLAHAALIGYPRYLDPVTRQPCPVEVAVDRLASGAIPRRGLGLRLLAKAQGLAATQAWIWRR